MKKKVLVILNRLVIGGQALDTIPLLYHLKDDFEILILYGCKEKDEVEVASFLTIFNNIPSKPIKYFKRSFNPIYDVFAFFSILQSIRRFRPNIVHTHGLKSGLLGRTSAYISSVPCIIHTFHGHHFHSYFGSFISGSLILAERFLTRLTTKIIAISKSQAAELAVTYKIAPANKIEIIPLGIDEKAFSPGDVSARDTFRTKYQLTPQSIAVGIIGRIVPVKNYTLFVQVAAGILQTTRRDVKFFVIGDGTEKIGVQQQFAALGISYCENSDFSPGGRVIFTSWLPDISKALHGLDIIVLTSHNEGTPMSIIEAQFCGKPVVATNVGGVKDTLLDEDTGFLVPPGDIQSFTAKLGILVDNDVLRYNMGNKASAFAAQHFSKTKEINSFRALYNGCINSQPGI